MMGHYTIRARCLAALIRIPVGVLRLSKRWRPGMVTRDGTQTSISALAEPLCTQALLTVRVWGRGQIAAAGQVGKRYMRPDDKCL